MDLQGRGEGGADEAADDGGDLPLDGDVIAVGVTEVLHPERGRDGDSIRNITFFNLKFHRN